MTKKKRSVKEKTPADDLDRILAGLQAPEETIRAKAVSQICPCRMGWEGYQQAMEVVAALQKDPSPLVRGAARHVVLESFQMVSSGLPTSPRTQHNEMAARKRRFRWGDNDR
ncbi:MAG: hypothetical protein KY468_06865 [Armatimonadetes bacterium]|nr:hypothetical protein [Armatimonadota bacterium]